MLTKVKKLKELSKADRAKNIGSKGYNYINSNDKNLNKLIKTIHFYYSL